jgi:hypothetical protein
MRPLEEYISLIGSQSREAFAKANPEPFLLFEHPAPRGRPPWGFKTTRISQAVREAAEQAKRARDLHRYAVVVLGPSGRWGERISVGRAGNNDIALTDNSVSKLHAYFTCDAQGVSVRDMGSRNGTRVGGELLDSNSIRRLQTGDIVTFGTVSVTLLGAGELYDFMQRLLVSGGGGTASE